MLVESFIDIGKGKIHGGVPKQLGQYAQWAHLQKTGMKKDDHLIVPMSRELYFTDPRPSVSVDPRYRSHRT